MRFCQDHWDRIRKAIEDRGLYGLVAPDGETAAEQQADQLRRAGEPATADGRTLDVEIRVGAGPPDEQPDDTVTPTNFDPLMSAHWAIASNAMSTLGPDGAMYLLAGEDDENADPIDFKLYPNGDAVFNRLTIVGVKKVWPRCPLCYLGIAHELTCGDRRCSLPRVDGYAWMIDRAADDSREKAVELGLVDA